MINSFNEFLLERGGFPNPINPYAKVLEKKCVDIIDKYMERKGKFANYTETIEFDWNDFKDFVKKEDFAKYPVEKITLKFNVKIKTEQLDIKGSYHNITECKFKIKSNSFFEKSESEWEHSDETHVGMALHLRVDITLVIPMWTKSYQYDLTNKFVISPIEHELTHSFQDFKNRFEYHNTNRPVVVAAEDLQEKYQFKRIDISNYSIRIGHYTTNLFFNIYVIDETEINAFIAETHGFYSDSIKKVKDLLDFNSDAIYSELMNDIEGWSEKDKKNTDKLMSILDGLATEFVERYKLYCAEWHVKENKNIIKLKGMTFKQLLEYWEPKFHHAGEYMLRKINKLKFLQQTL